MSLYLRQLLAGRDFARSDVFASQMANFVYLIGDEEQRMCMVVDPAWDIRGILDVVDRDEMTLVGALVTHYHPDHIGGNIFGHDISGTWRAFITTPCEDICQRVRKRGREVCFWNFR